MITDEIGGGGGGAGISGSALANLLTGYATQDWVGENYISIEFFSRLFQAHGTNNGQQTDIAPNDMDSTITSIEAMFGFWTDYYLSALGNGGGLGSTLYLSTLADVLISSPANNQVLTYNATTGKWVNANGGGGDYLPLKGGTLTGSTTEYYENVLNVVSNKNNTIVAAKLSYFDGNGCFIGTSKTTSDKLILHLASGITGTGGEGAISRFVVTANGNVGIGVQNPSYLFVCNGTAVASKFMESRGAYNYWVAVGVKVNNHLYSADSDGVVDIGNISGGGGGGIADPIQYLPFTSINSGNSGYVGRGSNSNDDIQLTSYNGGVGLGVLGQDNILYINTSKNCGIGTMSPSCKLHVIGDIYATGAVTALSDARKKDVQGEAKIGVEQIADAPAVQFLWKGKRAKEGLQVGTLAQYWQGVLPEVVMDKGGELSMQYGVAAIVSAIITARKVVDHERRISELEKENERLRTEVEQLRLN